MGFDLSGLKPNAEVGIYFRNNCWWWRPLAEYVLSTCADIFQSEETEYWRSNDGQQVSEETAKAVAIRLIDLVKSGATKRYEDKYKTEMVSFEDEDCWLCKGTGYRDDFVGQQARIDNPEYTCNGCDGKGKRRPSNTWYPFSEENISEFAEFCEASGGFEIY